MTLARLKEDAAPNTQLGPLPSVLVREDVRLYRQIIEVQKDGRWDEADKLIGQVENPILMGHVLAQRYLHPTAYISEYSELDDWLGDYGDHPQAERIYRLARKRQPGSVNGPAKPVEGFLNGSGQELLQERPPQYKSDKERSRAQSVAARKLGNRIINLVSRDRPTQALELLKTSDAAVYTDEVERDLSRWWIARGYFANQKFDEAFAIASEAADRSGTHEPRLHWTAGLAAWRKGEYDRSFDQFRQLAYADAADGEDGARGAFWAARAAIRAGKPDQVAQLLTRAATISDEFYGLLAKALLGRTIHFDWHETDLRGDMRELLLQFDGSKRAIALSQIGDDDMAAAEIRKLAARSRQSLLKALTALAEALKLPAAQMRVAQRLRLLDGKRHDGAMFPIPHWQPASDFIVDRALIYAIARAESGFDPSAKSSRGAHGVMQMLPSTAKRMAARSPVTYGGKEGLFSPEQNIELGQIYIDHLLGTDTVNRSILHLCLAYNGGLRRLARWSEELKDVADDPLLFLESIPVAESRLYTKKVMANLWAYRIRLGQPLPSLDALASGRWPLYHPYDAQEGRIAGPY